MISFLLFFRPTLEYGIENGGFYNVLVNKIPRQYMAVKDNKLQMVYEEEINQKPDEISHLISIREFEHIGKEKYRMKIGYQFICQSKIDENKLYLCNLKESLSYWKIERKMSANLYKISLDETGKCITRSGEDFDELILEICKDKDEQFFYFKLEVHSPDMIKGYNPDNDVKKTNKKEKSKKLQEKIDIAPKPLKINFK